MGTMVVYTQIDNELMTFRKVQQRVAWSAKNNMKIVLEQFAKYAKYIDYAIS